MVKHKIMVMIGCKPETSLLSVNFHSGLKLHGNRKIPGESQRHHVQQIISHAWLSMFNAIEHVSIRICFKRFELSNQNVSFKVKRKLYYGKWDNIRKWVKLKYENKSFDISLVLLDIKLVSNLPNINSKTRLIYQYDKWHICYYIIQVHLK